MAKSSSGEMKTLQQQSLQASSGPGEAMRLEVTMRWVRRPLEAQAEEWVTSYGEDSGALGQKQPGGNALKVDRGGSEIAEAPREECTDAQQQTMVIACGPDETLTVCCSIEAARSAGGISKEGGSKAQGTDPGDQGAKGAGNALRASKHKR